MGGAWHGDRVTLYTRHQLALLLAATALAALGLAVGHVRRTHPEVVERLERFDRVPESPDPVAVPPAAPGASPRRPERPATLRPADGEAPSPEPIDLNRARAGDLMRLPGVGPVLATRIVESRDTDGPFASVEELRRVRGLHRSTLDRLRPLVTVTR